MLRRRDDLQTIEQKFKGHMSRQHLVNTTKKCGLEFHFFVIFHFCFTNFHCNENSASILCFCNKQLRELYREPIRFMTYVL